MPIGISWLRGFNNVLNGLDFFPIYLTSFALHLHHKFSSMRKVYHLSTCSTCQKIIRDLKLDKSFELQDIKSNKITPEQLDEMKELAGSYEILFSRKAMKFRIMNLHEQTLTEKDFRDLILEEYTFLKRPVVLYNNEIFIGSAKKNVDLLKQLLSFE